MAFTHISVDVQNGIARIALARPEASNALDLVLARELRSAVAMIADDPDARTVLVVGEGPRFCAGGDLKAMLTAEDRLAYVRDLAVELDLAFQELTTLPLPVVAAVHGSVAGAGLALMLSCDVVVAAESTVFVAAYPGVGLTPDCGLSWLLPRTIGQQRALHFLLSNRRIGSSEAASWGLVAEVVEGEDLVSHGTAVARGFADGPAWALGQTRQLLRHTYEESRAQSGAREAEVVTAAADHSDARERMAAFLRR